MKTTDLIQLFANIASVLSLIVALFIYGKQKQRARRVETLQQLDALYDGYYSVRDLDWHKDYKAYVAYMSKLERFAKAVNNKVLLLDEVKKNYLFFQTLWIHGFLQEIISQRRKQFHREDYYADLVKMLGSLGIDTIDL